MQLIAYNYCTRHTKKLLVILIFFFLMRWDKFKIVIEITTKIVINIINYYDFVLFLYSDF